jgi:predicted HTH transcriptional regulator
MMVFAEEELLERLRTGRLTEIDASNVELKRSWDQGNGKKISAFANRVSTAPQWMCIGVLDNGALAGHDQSWAKQTEETVSQHINKYLDPQITCLGITCHEIGAQWFLLIKYTNPGSVVYWNNSAYKAAGTTIDLMTQEEVMQLTVALPGLTDFSAQAYTSEYDRAMATEFAKAVAERRHGTTLESIGELPPADSLKRIGINNSNTERILFSDIRYRVVKYNREGTPIANDSYSGLYTLLRPKLLAEVQSWTQEQLRLTSDPYPLKALKEGFANAVAHAAYFDSDGDVILELFPEKLCISNLCVRESQYFANKWFSRSHKTINRVLMEALRLAGFVDELGRGKNLIFAEFLRNGKKPPEVILEGGGRYDRWRLYLYASAQDRQQLRVFERLKEMYHDEHKALIANALVLWRGHTVSSIRQYVDGESSHTFAEVLADLNGPIFYYQKKDEIVLRRWVRILLGEGKDSKQLSVDEEEELLEFASKIHMDYNRGYITPKELREHAGMGHTPSEVVLSSQILKRWTTQGKVKKVKKGLYQFLKKYGEDREALRKLFATLIQEANAAEQPPSDSMARRW